MYVPQLITELFDQYNTSAWHKTSLISIDALLELRISSKLTISRKYITDESFLWLTYVLVKIQPS